TANLIGTGLGAAAGVLRQNKLNNDSFFDFGEKNIPDSDSESSFTNTGFFN
ncbi:hypothetical protein LCGC14_1508170, partial [marine sediment metagenome]